MSDLSSVSLLDFPVAIGNGGRCAVCDVQIPAGLPAAWADDGRHEDGMVCSATCKAAALAILGDPDGDDYPDDPADLEDEARSLEEEAADLRQRAEEIRDRVAEAKQFTCASVNVVGAYAARRLA